MTAAQATEKTGDLASQHAVDALQGVIDLRGARADDGTPIGVLDELLPEQLAILEAFGFEPDAFQMHRDRLASGEDLEKLGVITTQVSRPEPSRVRSLPADGSMRHDVLARRGIDAIERGELAIVILAGGRATRMNNKVKGCVPLLGADSPTFLDAHLADVDRNGRGQIDVTIMTSFATHDVIRQALSHRNDVNYAPQGVSLRLNADGSVYRAANPLDSLYGPGHGDLPGALKTSGTLDRLRDKGVKTVLMVNVDNVGATIDPVIFARHQNAKMPISVELAMKIAGDRGGLPVEIDGKLVLAETSRLPKDFDDHSFPFFNTNTMWIDLEALDGPHDWTWSYARKQAEDGTTVIQAERLVGELTWWNRTQFLLIPRDGYGSRFLPVKDFPELEKRADEMKAVLNSRLGYAIQ